MTENPLVLPVVLSDDSIVVSWPVRCRATLELEDAAGERRRFRCRRRRGHPLADPGEPPISAASHMSNPFDLPADSPIGLLLWVDEPTNLGAIPDSDPRSIAEFGE